VPETPLLPVARVAVDVPLAHLDRPFDYAVTTGQDADAVPGARVRVRFSGKLRDGFILERLTASGHAGTLAPLHKVTSPEPVLTAEVAGLIRAVADHYAGCFADVMRLAIPPRHAATEQAAPFVRSSELPQIGDSPIVDSPIQAYPSGLALLTALRAGGRPRAAWQVVPSTAPSGDWASGLAAAARACVDSGRGAVLVVPDARDVQRLVSACAAVLGATGFVVLTADQGPAARYRSYLAARRGDVKVVIGNRAAAFAPVANLGLVAIFDDGDDLHAEPRAPYPHARDVLALRASATNAAFLVAGYGRTAEVQRWLDGGWLGELSADRTFVRHTAPRVRVAVDTDIALARDPAARMARVPHEVFEMVRGALPQGPVLIQVPRAGYLVALVCGDCREPARCQHCEGPLRAGPLAGQSDGGQVTSCRWCDRPQVDWECRICGSHRLRAPVVGAERTVEELGRAFPRTPVLRSVAGHVLDRVEPAPSLVVATPGAEPPAECGYAGAVLLDTALLLLRADLRAGEEALRRWLAVVALVRSGADGGTVIAVGDSGSRPLQALVRMDPARFAARELGERAEAGFPPAVKLVLTEGSPEALADFVRLLRAPASTQLLGPAELSAASPSDGPRFLATLPSGPLQRLTLRSPRSDGRALVAAVKAATSVRSAHKSEGALRVRVDPAVID
jgi:primosomal protein N' (replication factor Y)